MDTVEYWHQLYGDNMTKFFDILSVDNSIEDTFNLFSNKYLDSLFKPQWERFGLKFEEPKMNGNYHQNGNSINKTEDTDDTKNSSCCVLS